MATGSPLSSSITQYSTTPVPSEYILPPDALFHDVGSRASGSSTKETKYLLSLKMTCEAPLSKIARGSLPLLAFLRAPPPVGSAAAAVRVRVLLVKARTGATSAPAVSPTFAMAPAVLAPPRALLGRPLAFFFTLVAPTGAWAGASFASTAQGCQALPAFPHWQQPRRPCVPPDACPAGHGSGCCGRQQPAARSSP